MLYLVKVRLYNNDKTTDKYIILSGVEELTCTQMIDTIKDNLPEDTKLKSLWEQILDNEAVEYTAIKY